MAIKLRIYACRDKRAARARAAAATSAVTRAVATRALIVIHLCARSWRRRRRRRALDSSDGGGGGRRAYGKNRRAAGCFERKMLRSTLVIACRFFLFSVDENTRDLRAAHFALQLAAACFFFLCRWPFCSRVRRSQPARIVVRVCRAVRRVACSLASRWRACK